MADFTGTVFHLPPGIEQAPRFIDPPAHAVELDLAVAGRTIVPTEIGAPLVVNHPNRFGVAENLTRLRAIAEQGTVVYVRLDPLLIDQCPLPPSLVALVDWPLRDPGPRQRAGWRLRLAADFIRRRLRQVPGVSFISPSQAGGAVGLILPFPARQVSIRLEAANARTLVAGPWEGSLVVNCGWWHSRGQLSAVADAISEILKGNDPPPIPPDRFDRLPNDLAWRQLDSIQAPNPEEMV